MNVIESSGELGWCQHHRYLLPVGRPVPGNGSRGQPSILNLDVSRKGLYPIKGFPQLSGMEASGTIVALPTDETLLNDGQYKLRGLKLGSRVVVVRHPRSWLRHGVPIGIALLICCASTRWECMQNTRQCHGPRCSLFRIRCLSKPQPLLFSKVRRSSFCIWTRSEKRMSGLTAITLMTESHNVQKGESVLVHTVAGGLGLLFTQIAKSRGATVIGTTSTEAKSELARSYGADHVILYPKENTVDRVLEITKGEGVHSVFDGVGKDT